MPILPGSAELGVVGALAISGFPLGGEIHDDLGVRLGTST